MKTALFFVFVAFAGYAAAQTCVDLSTPAVRTLSFCDMYNGGPSCCTVDADRDLGGNFTARIAPLYGSNNCAMNLKNVLCAVACSPGQAAFIYPTSLAPLSINVYMEEQTAAAIYQSCKGRCIYGGSFAPTMTAEQLFGAKIPQSFLQGLSSSSDPFYPANMPRFTYVVGTSPISGMYYNQTALGTSAQDTYGCTGVPRCFGAAGAPAARDLTFCPEYASSGCCTKDIEASLEGNFTKVRAILGTDGCADNVRKLFCAWTCGPNQYDFISYQRGYETIPATLNVSVNFDFADGMFRACKDHCYDDHTGSPVTVGTKFSVGAPASILYFFGSASDPSYHANTDSLPVVTYQVGTPGFNTTASVAKGADLTGCTAPTTTTTTGAANSLVFPMVAIFAALLLALLA